jgi:(p)ppGpp synthase/HD superfamily hydrolase
MQPALPTFAAVMDRFAARPCPAPATRHPGFVELGPRFDEALLYAAAAHRQQPRKGTPVPYMSHLLGVTSIALTYGAGENQAIGALLHDTVEDCGNEHEAVIGELFGDEVLHIVMACTDSAEPAGQAKAGWRGRKERYIEHLADLPASDPALLVSCSDKVHNAEAIVADLDVLGAALWERFRGKTPEDNLWYYAELSALFNAVAATPGGAVPAPLAARLRTTSHAMAATHHRLSGR